MLGGMSGDVNAGGSGGLTKENAGDESGGAGGFSNGNAGESSGT